MARRGQKVNYHAMKRRKDNHCQIYEYHISPETAAAGMSLLSDSKKKSKTQIQNADKRFQLMQRITSL